MKRTGFAELPLHYGKAPPWLVKRMIKLAKSILVVLLDDFGHDVFLQRISDPHWFQALGCVLGYDWHSSGVTTVLTSVLKSVLNTEEFGLAACGGKGKASTRTIREIGEFGEVLDLSTEKISNMKYASRMSAKVDNTAIQAGYPLYHHAFFLSENGKWAVIQQGMSVKDRTARRYHWLSERVDSFVAEPHNAIVGDVKREIALNMTASESEGCRRTSVDIVRDEPKKFAEMLKSIRASPQKSLLEWIPPYKEEKILLTDSLSMPRKINWRALRKAYQYQPRDYEELLNLRGIGPSTVRGLALISELIYGDRPSWKDPVKYSFAYGGKDGVPFPVDRKTMDESIQLLEETIKNARFGDKEKLRSLKRLKTFTKNMD